MGIYSEEILTKYCSVVSDTEAKKIENAKSMIKDAVNDSNEFSGLDYEIFEQGSYANNTNVKFDSDIDVCVMLKSTFYGEYPDGLTYKDYKFEVGITYDDYKRRAVRALNKKFGDVNMQIGNKSIKIKSNSYRVNADVVIAFQYRDYKSVNSKNPDIYTEGTKFISGSNDSVINYPKQHIFNGKSKDEITNLGYKKLVKIFKKIKNNMEEKGLIDAKKISSFLVESLVWNVPNGIITNNDSWLETVKVAIKYLHNEIKNNKCSEWREVSECLYLFRGKRKWTQQDAQDFLLKMWRHMEYK
ncbi:MAG: nucleotidyltransferase [Endomicrobium sp.]|nr:nucleotidyltransferase [Endomicrobium sp.]